MTLTSMGPDPSLVEAAIEAAGAEISAKAREQRTRDREKFRIELAAADERLEQERLRTEEQEQAAKLALEQVADAEARALAVDTAMLEAVETKASERFGQIRTLVRAASVAAALTPLVVVAYAVMQGTDTFIGLLVAAGFAALAAAAAMDRPGAWLSKLIQRFLERRAETSLRELGRHDLASDFELTWEAGTAKARKAE